MVTGVFSRAKADRIVLAKSEFGAGRVDDVLLLLPLPGGDQIEPKSASA